MSFFGFLRNLFAPRPTPHVIPTPFPVPPKPQPVSGDQVAVMVSLHNAARTSMAYRPALTLDPALTAAAQRHAEECAAWGALSHTGWDTEIRAEGYRGSLIAQNLEAGSSDANSAFSVLMADPPHRANILGVFTKIGVGIADGKGMRWWAINYGG